MVKMGTYVCRTCLYVCNNEFSFKKLEKVKDVLESCVPEIKNILMPNSIICEQCYQFLKCLKKFKEKCLQAQNRLCSVNVDNIRENSDIAINETRWQLRSNAHYQQNESQNINSVPASNRGAKRQAERVPVIDIASTNEMTSKMFRPNIYNNLEPVPPLTQSPRHKPNKILGKSCNSAQAVDLTVRSPNSIVSNPIRSVRIAMKKKGLTKSPSDGLNAIFNAAVDDSNNSNNKHVSSNPPNTKRRDKPLINIHSIYVTPKNTKSTINVTPKRVPPSNEIVHKVIPKNSQTSVVIEKNDTLPPPEMPVLTSSNDDSDLEIFEIDDEEGNDGRIVELKIRRKSIVPDMSSEIVVCSNDDESNHVDVNHNHHNEFEDMPVLTKVKEEASEEQNPGFFNKKNADGRYVCRMCSKVYKTSKGLYNHTKDKHSKDLKFFHCGFCSFFTLWRTALRRHCQNYHVRPVKKTKTPIEKKSNVSENIYVLVNKNTPNIAKLSEEKKTVSISPLNSMSKLDSSSILKCHMPDCCFHCFSRVILNQHLISRHKLSLNGSHPSVGPSRVM